MPTRKEIEDIMKQKCKTMADFREFTKPVYPKYLDNPNWKTEEEKLEGNIDFLLDRYDRDPNIEVRLCRHLGIETTQEELLRANRQTSVANKKQSQGENVSYDVIDKLNKRHRTILKWFYDNEFFAGGGYEAEISAAAPLIGGMSPLDMKILCQDLCSFELLNENCVADRPPIRKLHTDRTFNLKDVDKQYKEQYYYSLTNGGRKIAAHLRNRQPWRRIVKAPWEWVKAALGTVILFVVCRWVWGYFNPEQDALEQQPPAVTQPQNAIP